MKNLLSYLSLSLLLFTSCTKDPCEDTICYNGGQCDNGDCLCLDWYSGPDCSEQERDKYYGSYTGAFNFYDASGSLIQGSQTTIVVLAGSEVNELTASDLPFVLSTPGTGLFDIPTTRIVDPNLGPVFWQGKGSFNGSQLGMNGSIDASGQTITFSFTGTR